MYSKKIKKVFIVILAFLIVLGNNITKVRVNTKTIENVDDDITKQYVILTDSRHTYNTVVAEYDDLAEESENSTNLEEQSIVVVDLTEEEAGQLSSEEGIVCIEEDYVMKGSSEEDYIVKGLSEENDNIKTEWNTDMVNGDDCDSDSLETVKVAVIDSGIDYTDGIDVKVRKNFIPGQDDTNILYEDIAGHGTGIAGIISAAQNDDNYLNGITSNVELYSARVLDGNNTSPVSRVVNGIYWAIEKGVNIINLSMGLQQKSFILEKAIKDAYNEGILIIAAVGNDENAGVEYPAAYDEVMGVASVDSNGIHSNYSATGLEVEISAPGELVKTASCFDGEIIASGTSLAVPHVVGVAAMLWGRDLSKSNEFIRQLINATAKEAGGKEEYGYGIVDAGYAMETYDLFAEAYTERKTVEDITKEIGENEIPIEIFDSDDYIEGRWSTDVHEEYAGLGDISGAELTLLKKAACISDNYNNKDLLGLAHMYQNPQFHGFFDKNNPNDYTNYIACYIMLTKIAKSFSMGNYTCILWISSPYTYRYICTFGICKWKFNNT